MIENLFSSTCTIERKDTTSVYGGESGYVYYVVYENEPCLFIQSNGRKENMSGSAINTVIDGYLRITKEIASNDRLIINGYYYDILNVIEVKDLITEQIDYWQGSAVRQVKKSVIDDELIIKE